EIADNSPEAYGVDITPRLTVVKVTEPAVRSAGIKVEDVAALVAKLKTAGAI
ncbi:MAG: electron transfer flavoprotein subunit beta/FixA family protein, partial [Hyphomonas sp.]